MTEHISMTTDPPLTQREIPYMKRFLFLACFAITTAPRQQWHKYHQMARYRRNYYKMRARNLMTPELTAWFDDLYHRIRKYYYKHKKTATFKPKFNFDDPERDGLFDSIVKCFTRPGIDINPEWYIFHGYKKSTLEQLQLTFGEDYVTEDRVVTHKFNFKNRGEELIEETEW